MPAEPRQTAVLFASAGHAAVDPVQFSAMSQTPAEPRQVVALETKESAGHVSLTPLQLSAVSQMPADGRQGAVLFASAGHAAVDPVQFSTRSQMPAEPRHGVELEEKLSAGQVL